MFSFTKDLQKLNDLEAIGARWIEEVQRLGVVRASYHLTPAFASQVGANVEVIHYGFSRELIALYNDLELRKNDPIPDAIMRLGRPKTWRRVLADLELDSEQKRFVELAGKLGLDDGFGIPLFGPNGRESYSSFDIGRRITIDDENTMQLLVGIGQIVHLRICTVVRDRFMRKIDLSARERDVLRWIGSSKSIGEIASILNISSATVDTYMRRLYAKLGAHNRVDAVMIAISHGLLRI